MTFHDSLMFLLLGLALPVLYLFAFGTHWPILVWISAWILATFPRPRRKP